jgi:hypothetical protein
MPAKLTTTLPKIPQVPNKTNPEIMKNFASTCPKWLQWTDREFNSLKIGPEWSH